MLKASGNSHLERYGLVSRLLHWLIAVGIAVLVGLGWYMTGLSYYDPWYHKGPEIHKALGTLVFGAGVFRLIWVWLNPSPPLMPSLKPWERLAAKTVHRLLAAFIAVLPITGYVVSTSAGSPVSVFGLFELPALLPKSETVRNGAEYFHYYLAYGGAALIFLHAGAALKHHFISRDDTLRRMI